MHFITLELPYEKLGHINWGASIEPNQTETS
jgi:hypothetical protein